MKMRMTGVLAMTCVGLLVLQANAAEPRERRRRSGREEGKQVQVAAEKKAVPGYLWHNLDRAIRLNDVDAAEAAAEALAGAYGTGEGKESLPGAVAYVADLEKWIESQTPKYPATNKVLVAMRAALADLTKEIAQAKAGHPKVQPPSEGRQVVAPSAPVAQPAAPAPVAPPKGLTTQQLRLFEVIASGGDDSSVKAAVVDLFHALVADPDNARAAYDFCDQTIRWLKGTSLPQNQTFWHTVYGLEKDRAEAMARLEKAVGLPS